MNINIALPFVIFVVFGLISCRLFVAKDPKKGVWNNGHNGRGPALAVFGDSLSTAVLASSPMGTKIHPNTLDRFNRIIFSGYFSMRKYQMEFSEYYNSAMTTDRDWGVRAAIAERHGFPISEIPVYFFAKWGGRTDHLSEFEEEIKENYKNREPAEYVLVEIGGNDFCKEKTAEKFSHDYKNFLDRIFQLHTSSTIIISDIPPLPKLLQYDHRYQGEFSCELFRAKFCKRLFYKDASKVFDEFNKVIAMEAMQRMKARDKVFFTNEPSQLNLTKEDIAFDCFHPSYHGHRKLARIFQDLIASIGK